MKNIIEYLYCCFYCMVVAKNFRHARAAFLTSVAITLYSTAIVFGIVFYFKIYNYINPLYFSISLFALMISFIYFLNKKFGNRSFYTEAIKKIELVSKIFLGLAGVILFLGSAAALIYSFLAFAHRT